MDISEKKGDSNYKYFAIYSAFPVSLSSEQKEGQSSFLNFWRPNRTCRHLEQKTDQSKARKENDIDKPHPS